MPKTQKQKTRTGRPTRQTRKLWKTIDNSEMGRSKPSLGLIGNYPETSIIRRPCGNIYIDHLRCPMCQSDLSVMDDGSHTCTSSDCGYMGVYEVNMAPDANLGGGGGGDAGVDMTRHGSAINPLLPESSFGSQIICKPGSSTEMKFISRISNWGSSPSHEKMLYNEFNHISTMAQNANIPANIIEHAFIIHKCNSIQQLYRGGNRDGIKAGSIYIACILNDCPRTPHEIADMFRLSHKNAMFGCTQAMNMIHQLKASIQNSELGIGIDGLDFDKLTNIKSAHFINRYCSNLSLSNDITHLAKFISKIIDGQHKKYNSKPHSIAGGIILYISNHLQLGIHKSKIANICGVSEVTIGNCYKWIQSNWPDLIPTPVLEKYKRDPAPDVHPPSKRKSKKQ